MAVGDMPGVAVVGQDQQAIPITSVTQHLGPDTSTGKTQIEETEELRKRREEAEKAATEAATAQAVNILGATPGQEAPTGPPTVMEPTAAPTGEGLTGGIPQAATLADQRDINAQALAAERKQLLDEQLKEQTRLDTIRQQRETQARSNMANAEQEYLAAKKDIATKENKGFLHTVLGAFAAAAGAYGSAITHTPNFALDILNKADNDELERKKAKLDATYESYKAAGASLKDIDPWYDKQLGRYLAQQKLKMEQVLGGVEVSLSRFPQARLAAEAAAKEKLAEVEQKKMEWAKDSGQIHRSREERKTADVQTTSTPKGQEEGGKTPPRETVTNYIASKMQARLLNEFEDIVDKNPKAWEAFRAANEELAKFEAGQESSLKGILSLGQSAGALPIALDQRLKGESEKVVQDARRLNQLWPIIETGEGRIMDPVGVLNESTLQQARKRLNLYTMKPKEAIAISKQFRGKFEEEANMLAPSAMGGQQPQQQPLEPPPVTPGGGKPTNLPGVPEIPAEGQTAAQKRYTESVTKDVQAAKARPTNTELINVRQRVKEARMVKKGDPEYQEAQDFIKFAEGKYGKKVVR